MRRAVTGLVLIAFAAISSGPAATAKRLDVAVPPVSVEVVEPRVEAYAAGTVPTSIDAAYLRRKKVIAGFISTSPAGAVHEQDVAACLYDRKVTLFKSVKVGLRWKDTKYATQHTDEEGFFGWQWKRGHRVPSGWWTIKVAKVAFSSEYGGIVVCAPGVLAERLKT